MLQRDSQHVLCNMSDAQWRRLSEGLNDSITSQDIVAKVEHTRTRSTNTHSIKRHTDTRTHSEGGGTCSCFTAV